MQGGGKPAGEQRGKPQALKAEGHILAFTPSNLSFKAFKPKGKSRSFSTLARLPTQT